MARNKFKLLKNRKKIMIVVIALILLGGIGLWYAYVSNNSVLDSSKVVVDEELTSNKEEVADSEETHIHDENCNHKNSESVEVQGEENVATETIGETSKDKEVSDNKETSSDKTSSEDKKSETTSSSSSSSSNNKTNTTTSNSNTSTSKPSSSSSSSSEHTHNWVATTEQVHHDEEGHWEDYIVSQAWTEEVPIYEEQARSICNGCGKDITGNVDAHMRDQMIAGNLACGGYHVEYNKVQVGTNKIEHPAVTDKKWVVDKAAWTETVTTGYKCSSCGATK